MQQIIERNFLSYLLLFITCLHVAVSSSHEKDTFPETHCVFPSSECECNNYEDAVALVCQNVHNFINFNLYLSSGSYFKVNTTFRIFFSETRVLPRGIFTGLILDELYTYDGLLNTVEDGAFDRMLQLRRFTVQNSTIMHIPDFRPVRDSLQNLKLEDSPLLTIRGDQLKNLRMLETLSLANDYIYFIANDVFEGTENLVTLDLSNNFLDSVPEYLFDPLKKLQWISLSNNRLIHLNYLFEITHPQFIYLDHNNLTNLDTMFHPNMSLVETIQLSHNPISKVTVDTFNGKLNGLRFLYLDHCLIQEFDASHYAGLKSLSVLDLSHNNIEKVSRQPITFGRDVELNFTGNKITEFNAILSPTVKAIYLDKNLMTSLNWTLHTSQVSQVSMAENRIQSLKYKDFFGARGIKMLNLHWNAISSIDGNTFMGIRNDLLYLDLSRNDLYELNGCVQSLSLLISLNLADNHLWVLEPNVFKGLNKLTDLDLQGNFITTLGHEVQELSLLNRLFVSNNRIRIIKGNQLPIRLQYVFIDGNPLQCDCQIWSFLEHLNSTRNLKTDVTPCVAGESTSALRCPEGCRCFCTDNVDDHYLSVNCSSTRLTQLPPIFSSMNASMPDERNPTSILFQLHTNMGRKTWTAAFTIQDKIGLLDFSHNNLLDLNNAHLPKGTKNLHLDNNLLSQPPIMVLDSLEELNEVTLSDNPWTCECKTTAFKQWILSHSEFILDVNETRCGQGSSGLSNQTIWTLADIDLCPVNIKTNSIILIVLGVLSCFCAIVAVVIAWVRYQNNIKSWLHAQGVTWVELNS